jgi:hypothetical protein
MYECTVCIKNTYRRSVAGTVTYIIQASMHVTHASKQNKFIGKSCCQITVSASGRGFSILTIQLSGKSTSNINQASSTTTTISGRATFGSESVTQQQPPPPHTTETCYIRLCQCFHSFGLRVRSLFWLGLAPFQPLEVH